MDRAKKGKQEAAKKVSSSDELIFLLCKTNNHNVFFLKYIVAFAAA